MLEIALHGSAADGTRLGARVLAAALARAGRPARVIAVEDSCPLLVAGAGEPRAGAPERHAIVLDAGLLAGLPADAVRGGGIALVNATAEPCGRAPLAGRVVAVDAGAAARAAGLGTEVATAAVGAFAAVTGLAGLPELQAAVAAAAGRRGRRHVAACTAAYLDGARERLAAATAGPAEE
jgi:Pyruvate/2-oxoacid:ferredoxin oxidoreductase gamma subunit